MRFAIFLMIALLITYGSLYPFSFAPADPESWQSLFSDFRLFTSRGDVLGNLLLFVPLGIAGMFAFSPRAEKTRALIVACAGLALAIALQWTQLYLPSRDAVVSDVVWNMLGLALGMSAAPAAVRIFHWEKTLPAIPLALLALWFAQELVPFIPTLDLQKIKDSLKPLLLDPDFQVPNAALHWATALLAGRLLAEIGGEQASSRWLALCMGIAVFGKVVVVSRALSLSLLIGWFAAWLIWTWIASWPEPRRATLIMLGLLFASTMAALAPFTLRSPAEFNWMPFSGQLEGEMLTNLVALIERLFVYAGVLWLIGRSKRSIWPGAICLAAFVVLLEAAQIFVAERSPDITEAIWVLIAAFALHVARVHMRRDSSFA